MDLGAQAKTDLFSIRVVSIFRDTSELSRGYRRLEGWGQTDISFTSDVHSMVVVCLYFVLR